MKKWAERCWNRCARKVRYGHMETAEKACERMAAKGVRGLTAYFCQDCSGFHIGHKSPGFAISISWGDRTFNVFRTRESTERSG